MESETNSLLNVPITEAERRTQRDRSHSGSSQLSQFPKPPTSNPVTQHARDRQFSPQVGRFSSLRQPGERYDDPGYLSQNSRPSTRPSTLPEIEEESIYSAHDDEQPIVSGPRSSNVPHGNQNRDAYAPVPSQPDASPPQSHGKPPQFWQPIWLRKSSLALMCLLLILIIVGLVVVCSNADHNDGYHLSSSSQHYAWTYVPTLIMLIVVAIWRQIDFHTKTLVPWKALALGPESPFNSILVDYVSEFQILALIAAFKRLHAPVFITITGFILALGVAIASTGLFFVGPRDFTDEFPTVLTSAFDASALDPAILSTSTFPNASIYTYVQSVVNGLGPQVGIAAGYAYVPPMLRSLSKEMPENATFTATVDTFVPGITCRAADVTLSGDAEYSTTDWPYNSTDLGPYGSPSNLTLNINEGDICDSWPELSFRALDPLHFIVPGQTLESRAQEIRCNDSSRDPILLLTMVQVEYTQDLLTNVTREEGGELPIALTTSRSVTRMVNVLCQADYTLSQVNVTNNTALTGVAALKLTNLPKAENKTLDGLSAANMTTIYSYMLGADHGLFTDGDPDENFLRTPAFDLLAWAAGTGSYDDLFDDSALSNAATDIYLGSMPEFAARNLVKDDNSTNAPSGPVASITWREERLFTSWTPVIMAITGLGIMALLLVALVILLPENVVPRNPNSIAANATFLSRSPELQRLLMKLQSPGNKGIAAALNGYEVGTAIAVDEGSGARSFKIHVTEGRPQKDVQDIAPNTKLWNPIWASLPVLAASFSIPLILLAILEVFQHRSDTNDGLWDVPDDRGTMIASHFVPAFVTLVVAAIINNLDFYIALFSPWAALFKHNAQPGHSIMRNVLGRSALKALWVSGKARLWGAHVSTLATIFASLLTVIISGLYVVKDFDVDGPTRGLTQLDNLNLNLISAYSVGSDNGAAAMFDLIQGATNATYPDGTYDEFAFPRVSLQELNHPVPSGSRLVGDMEGTLPALRANITCDPPTDYQLATVDSVVRVTVSYNLPQSCLDAADSINGTAVTFEAGFTPTGTEFGARLFDLRLGTNASEYGYLGESNASLVADNPAVGCPSLTFIWGNFELGNDDISNVEVAVCYQQVYSLDVNVTMQQDTTDVTKAGTFQTGTAQTNPNGTTDIFDFRIQENLARQLGDFAGSPNVDPFFNSMIQGNMKLDISRFMGNRSMAIMGISHTYRVYMAQVFNAILRESQTSTSTLLRRQSGNLNDIRTSMTQSRLVQDKTSKIILQVFLGLSAILILVGYIITKMRNVLTCNPCSIAGTMALLAGSDICYLVDDGICECCGKVRRSFRSADGRVHVETIHADDNEHADDDRAQMIRQGAEWMDDKTFARVFAGRTYSLGWWQANPKIGKIKRYGVDYGTPDGGEAGEWYLGRRRDSEAFEIFTEPANEGRGRSRALSDVNERGSYQRAEPSPGIEAHEMRNMAPQPGGRYGDP